MMFNCIQELFGDVGGMLESRLVRAGTAEVIYNSLEDAQKAVDLYHNRQLDGQPMNCLLVTPRSTSATSRLVYYFCYVLVLFLLFSIFSASNLPGVSIFLTKFWIVGIHLICFLQKHYDVFLLVEVHVVSL